MSTASAVRLWRHQAVAPCPNCREPLRIELRLQGEPRPKVMTSWTCDTPRGCGAVGAQSADVAPKSVEAAPC